MKIVKYKGGLGNQLFQYAFKRRLELIFGLKDIKSDLFYYNNILKDNIRKPRILDFNVSLNLATKEDLNKILKIENNHSPKSYIYKSKIYLEKTFNKMYFFEKNRNYVDLQKILKYDYFDGYWQSWKYTQGIEDVLREEIVIKEKLDKEVEILSKKIIKENSVFIGIRRGDYLKSKKNRNHYGETNLDYYKKAINLTSKKIKNPKYYVFSNDIKWVKNNLKLKEDFIFRDKYVSDSQELYLMSLCKHSIIGNSTFHWWGAWLRDNPEKIIIAPKKWFADSTNIDIIPDNWIKI